MLWVGCWLGVGRLRMGAGMAGIACHDSSSLQSSIIARAGRSVSKAVHRGKHESAESGEARVKLEVEPPAHLLSK